MNTGQIFEAQIQKSVPKYAKLYRLPNAAQSFAHSSATRFSNKNPFDYILWDSKSHILYAFELKSVKGKSITFERSADKTKEIHLHQIDGLNEWDKFDGIVCGFLIEFRELEKTIFLDIKEFNRISAEIPKQSFSFADLETYKIKYTIIPQKKARTRYTYDIDGFLSNMKI